MDIRLTIDAVHLLCVEVIADAFVSYVQLQTGRSVSFGVVFIRQTGVVICGTHELDSLVLLHKCGLVPM